MIISPNLIRSYYLDIAARNGSLGFKIITWTEAPPPQLPHTRNSLRRSLDRQSMGGPSSTQQLHHRHQTGNLQHHNSLNMDFCRWEF